MNYAIFQNYEELSYSAAEIIVQEIHEKPDLFICLPMGHTHRRLLEILVDYYREGKVDFSRCRFVGLFEWVGASPYKYGSSRHFLYNSFFSKVHVPKNQVYLFDGKAANSYDECMKMDQFIFKEGGIDLVVLGIGTNGHIGFNEPGSSFAAYSHISHIGQNAKLFGQTVVREGGSLTKAYTLGIKHILGAGEIIVLANGFDKAKIIRRTLNEKFDPNTPSNALKLHRNTTFLLDREAGSLLRIF
ncbi:glucosamine-6-phosphate deaminase [Bacillus sp. FJAT-27916]|uniref:glucosamine-6-phosphate deaminase n=1 Tax=Bacillus sp. FJAT-27916 TaxID=1679169 RepID=UPI000670E0FC|nr:glucosamine-6-phosphate deaminase [Bacillus sp. FJAT-27916]